MTGFTGWGKGKYEERSTKYKEIRGRDYFDGAEGGMVGMAVGGIGGEANSEIGIVFPITDNNSYNPRLFTS